MAWDPNNQPNNLAEISLLSLSLSLSIYSCLILSLQSYIHTYVCLNIFLYLFLSFSFPMFRFLSLFLYWELLVAFLHISNRTHMVWFSSQIMKTLNWVQILYALVCFVFFFLIFANKFGKGVNLPLLTFRLWINSRADYVLSFCWNNQSRRRKILKFNWL